MPPPETAAPSSAHVAVEPTDPGPAVADLDTIVSLSQATRLHLPVVRDLRRHQRGVGLRAPGRGAEEQRQARLVAGHGPGARRHRGPRCRHPHAPPGVGHLRARRLVLRPPRGVRHVPSPLPPRRAARRRGPLRHASCATRPSSSVSACAAPSTTDRSRLRGASTSCSGRTWVPSRTRPRSSTCAPRPPRAPTSTSGTSSRRAAGRCPSGSPRSASRSATRSAPATSSSGCASSSRWRCSTSWRPASRPRPPSRSGCRRGGPGTSATA